MPLVRSLAVLFVLGFTAFARADVDAAVSDYLKGANGVLAQLETLRTNAGSCGLVGSFVASQMSGSMKDQRQQMTDVTAAAKRGASGRPVIENWLKSTEAGNDELRSKENFIRNGLSTDSPTCKQAAAAFERLIKYSLPQPAKLRRILAEI